MAGICGKNSQVTLLLLLGAIMASVFGVTTLMLYNHNGKQGLPTEVQGAVGMMVFVWFFGIVLSLHLMHSLFHKSTTPPPPSASADSEAVTPSPVSKGLSIWWKVLALHGLVYWLAAWWFLTTLKSVPSSTVSLSLWEWIFSAMAGSVWILAAALRTIYEVVDTEASSNEPDTDTATPNPLEEPLLQNV